MRNRFFLFTSGLVICLLAAVAMARVSIDQARTIGRENLKSLIEQSYHYRVDYDTIIALPVHSRTIWKNDFYLLYFLKDDYFQVEMEVDAETGRPTILAMGTMSPPYHEQYTGAFNYRYFNVDSIMQYATMRRRLQQDSARLVYFGVMPRLGKRGVIWELFSSEGVNYFSLGGPSLTADQLIKELNLVQRETGNFTVDSIRMEEIMVELGRLEKLTDAEKRELKMYKQAYDSLVTALTDEQNAILRRFPVMRRIFSIEMPDTADGGSNEPNDSNP